MSVGYEYESCASLILWEKRTAILQGYELDPTSLGGWSLDKHHILNTRSGTYKQAYIQSQTRVGVFFPSIFGQVPMHSKLIIRYILPILPSSHDLCRVASCLFSPVSEDSHKRSFCCLILFYSLMHWKRTYSVNMCANQSLAVTEAKRKSQGFWGRR